MKKLFVAVLAIAALAACNKEEAFNGPSVDSKNKSIEITILNASSTRAAAEETVPGDVPAGDAVEGTHDAVVNDTDLKVLFADATGLVLNELQLTAQAASDVHESQTPEYLPGKSETAGTYVWHNVPAAVTKIAVVRYEAGDITFAPGTLNLSDYEILATSKINEGREIDDVVLYGADVDGLAKGDDCATINGVDYYIYTANVTVAPKLARLEINNIQCYDLGDLNDDVVMEGGVPTTTANFATVGIDELTLKTFSWTGVQQGDTLGSTATEIFSITIPENTVLKGSYAKADNVLNNDEVADDDAFRPATGKVWAWNFVPQNFAQMTLMMDALAYDYQLPVTNDLAINVTGLKKGDADITKYEAGNIYKLNLLFSEGDIAGQEGICVNVVVTIQDWTVNVVTPVFGK